MSVYDRALSAAEIATLPGGPAPTPTPTPAPPPPPPVADSDGDGIPDAQDTLPPGNLPPVAGQRVKSVAEAGTLQVKLPARARSSSSRARRRCRSEPS